MSVVCPAPMRSFGAGILGNEYSLQRQEGISVDLGKNVLAEFDELKFLQLVCRVGDSLG